ncbi:MAG: alpha/beta fold hydrolase BchO [Halieaceae bacterium]|nr:alpha/beta fold hydrolase BchO [Halieaceae bacterium]
MYRHEPPEDWPDRSCSRIVSAAGLNWHVQLRGRGPKVLLLHGTGASSHSWIPVARMLEDRFTVLAPDLPGQGYTQLAPPSQCSLPGMARSIGALLRELDFVPRLIAGHSAGAAVAASVCLLGACNPAAVVSINGALLPFGRAAAPVFSRAARLLAAAPVFPQLVALHAVPRKPVERMLRQTGSATPPEMIRCYRRLLGSSRHVAGTLRMMASWDLAQLEKNLDRLEPALVLLVGEGDRVVDPAQARELHARLPESRLETVAGLGHLGHEEAPAWFAERIGAAAGLADAA